MKYDPSHDPDPAAWLALDEQMRIQLAQDYHRREKIRLPNQIVHATIHAIVESQVALGEEIPVRATLRRRLGEGLDRHDARNPRDRRRPGGPHASPDVGEGSGGRSECRLFRKTGAFDP